MVALMGLVSFAAVLCLRLLEKLVQVSFQAKLNKAGGLIAGLFRGILVTSVVLVVCRQLPSDYLTASIDEHSLSGHFVSRVAPAVYDSISPLASRFLGTLRSHSS